MSGVVWIENIGGVRVVGLFGGWGIGLVLGGITLCFQNFSSILSGLTSFRVEFVVAILACRMSAAASR